MPKPLRLSDLSIAVRGSRVVGPVSYDVGLNPPITGKNPEHSNEPGMRHSGSFSRFYTVSTL